jgi:H+/Cl- antiporter ClcA
MPSSLKVEPSAATPTSPILKAFELWHRGAAWIFGPVVVGLIGVFMAVQSEYAGKVNKLLFTSFPLAPLVIMPAGFALIAFLCTRYFSGTAGSGIPQTIAALDDPNAEKKSKLLSVRIAFGKVVLTLGGLCIGASVGREGPTVQIGASVMHFFYGRGPFQTAGQRRILILAGGAAGIAAAFNTPLAGIMFAIEELSKKHVFNANKSTLITVVLAGLISLFFLGNYTYFGTTDTSLEWRSGAAVILVCGLIGGAAGGLFSRAMIAGSAGIPLCLGAYMRNRPIVLAAVCGLAVAIIGIMTDSIVFGTGYEVTRQTMEDHSPLPWYFSVAKMAAILLSTLSGIPGGIFAPSLAVGAGIGDNIASLMPSIAPHSAIVVLAMAAYLSGVTRAPITSFIIMMEMTNSHQMLLPLMSTTVLASSASKLICPTLLYQALAERFFPAAAERSQSDGSNR